MAAQIEEFTARPDDDSWTKIMGQGIGSLTSGDEFTFSALIQNCGTKADLYIAFVDGASAPASETANGVITIKDLLQWECQPINRKNMKAGWTCWVKCSSEIQIEAAGRKAATGA